MSIIGRKNIVIAGNTLEEVKADLASLETLMRSGMTSGCGGQTELAALEGRAAMVEINGWAPAGVMMAMDTPKVAPASRLSVTLLEEEGEDWDEEEEEDWDEEDWDKSFRRNFSNEAEDMVDIILDTVEVLDEPEVLTAQMIDFATEVLRIGADCATGNISRGEFLDTMLDRLDELTEHMDDVSC